MNQTTPEQGSVKDTGFDAEAAQIRRQQELLSQSQGELEGLIDTNLVENNGPAGHRFTLEEMMARKSDVEVIATGDEVDAKLEGLGIDADHTKVEEITDQYAEEAEKDSTTKK